MSTPRTKMFPCPPFELESMREALCSTEKKYRPPKVDSSKGVEWYFAQVRELRKEERNIDESERFDMDESWSSKFGSLSPMNIRDYPVSPLVKLYASLGLHLYNLLEGTNFVLDDLIKYNRNFEPLSKFFITLDACDVVSRTQQSFRVRVDERDHGVLDLTCPFAKPTGVAPIHLLCMNCSYDIPEELPGWPSDEALSDTNVLYVLEGSKLQDACWIRMYLELAIYRDNNRYMDCDLSLEIMKVLVQTMEDVEPPNERINAKSAIFYITFKGLPIRGFGEHVERKLVVRRVFHERAGCFSLKGELLNLE